MCTYTLGYLPSDLKARNIGVPYQDGLVQSPEFHGIVGDILQSRGCGTGDFLHSTDTHARHRTLHTFRAF